MTNVAAKPAFLEIVEPVLRDMPGGPLHDALESSYTEQADALRTIEECFVRLTSKAHDLETLKHFFHCWQQTNNSASSVAGQTCRVTLQANKTGVTDENARSYYDIISNLQRIIDEDFGAHGELMHADLYYRMATAICAGDDSWLTSTYSSDQAREFRSFLLHKRLRDRNVTNGLLLTLIHEIFTHGEVELIHPMFQAWLPAHLDISKKRAAPILAWITVHTGGLETEHFGHAVDAVTEYCAVTGATIDPDAAKDLFSTYLRLKAEVMAELIPGLS